MAFRLIGPVIASALLATATPAAAADIILGFDDITTDGAKLFENYGGLKWLTNPASGVSTYVAVDVDQNCANCNPTGFRGGRTSGTHVAGEQHGFGSTISSTVGFRMISTQLSSAWRNNMNVSFIGFRNGVQQWSSNHVVGTGAASLVTFNSGMIDELRVLSTGGVIVGQGTSVGAVFDDFKFSFSAGAAVPEPATWAMMIAGFGLIGGALRNKRQRLATPLR